MKDEELLWSYGVTMCGKYSDYDPFAPDPYPKSQVSNPKQKQSAPKTPSTAPKGGQGGGAAGKSKQAVPKPKGTVQAFIPEVSPYGLHARPFEDAAEANSDVEDSDAESEASALSSDVDEDVFVAPQPVYPPFVFPVHDVKRKIDISWEVRNELSSNIANSPFSAETKLNWRVIGLGGQARQKTELECFMLMDVPVTIDVDGLSILSMTNAAISLDPHKRGGALTK